MRHLKGEWQREGQVWYFVEGGIVYTAQIVPDGKLFNAFDLSEEIPEGQAGPTRIGQFESIDDAWRAVEKRFEETKA